MGAIEGRKSLRRAFVGVATAAAGIAVAMVAMVALASPVLAAGTAKAGPPYPEPVTGQRVYDYAGIFSPGAVAAAEAQIRTIEDRTGAQIAVYTQVKPQSDDLDKANADALALMNQWGVGRKGFDDGLVILFDMQTNLRHGQVSLYAGSGFRAAYLTDADRQAIFDNDMMPDLKNGLFDSALMVALKDIDNAATPEHANQLNQARILNAGVGIGVLILALFLIAFVLFNWYKVGRDPVYTTDDSVLMPAPPPGLTPAMATLLMDDRAGNRTLSAALVDLAGQGLVHFKKDDAFLKSKVSLGARGDWRSLDLAEGTLCQALAGVTGADGYIDVTQRSNALVLRSAISHFKSSLEDAAVAHGWLRGKPSSVTTRWALLGVFELVAAFPLFAWTATIEASGGFLGGAAAIVAGVVTLITAYFMPARTPTGAMLRAMLMAYRQTLRWTLNQSNSMDEVVAKRPLPWVTTPDSEMAWGVAFGLNDEIDGVMHRTVDQLEAAQAPSAALWIPMWYSTPGHGFSFSGGGGASAAGLYSASAIPDLGSMVSALGSIGSTGSTGGGGFGGGGGGGGGGAGGGF